MKTKQELIDKLNEVEKQLLEETGVLHFRDYKLDIENLTIEQLIIKFFMRKMECINYTHFTDNSQNKTQCYPGKLRSIDDCFLIMKSYIPSITLAETYEAVVNMDFERTINYYFCPDIEKRCVTSVLDLLTYREKRESAEPQHDITEDELNLFINK